jgi:hypothetical protein
MVSYTRRYQGPTDVQYLPTHLAKQQHPQGPGHVLPHPLLVLMSICREGRWRLIKYYTAVQLKKHMDQETGRPSYNIPASFQGPL